MSHLLAKETANGVEIVGYGADAGETLECEGCGESAEALLETDDSVMLCPPCFACCAGETE